MKRFFSLLFLFVACKDAYNPVLKNPYTNYLVVEGNIAAGNDSTIIHLSRTIAISDTAINQPELNANISVESEDGATYQLKNELNGVYDAAPLNINLSKKYRLHILTEDGKQYASDYVPVIQTPPIDSISWKLSEKGVTIYINTHDPGGNIKYYKWDYVQTWEHRASYFSAYVYEGDSLRTRNTDEQVYRCWSITQNTNINIGSTANLSSDIVFEEPLVLIPYGSETLSFVYSIAVKQNALTKEAFEFWQNLKKNTEQIGSIFDPQPFADFGNIHCISDALEPVIGFISAATVSSKRIYITKSDLSSWSYQTLQCIADTLRTAEEIKMKLYGGGYLVIGLLSPNKDILAVDAICADCRRQGGTTTKPSYMP